MKILRESKVAKRMLLAVFAIAVVALSLTFSGEKAMAQESASGFKAELTIEGIRSDNHDTM